ncbi:amidohydrolase family protein [Arcanobacterium haemolyticum]|nr:amidohydrolase family protein [Arcanobacterium haemolyticum]
MLWRGCIVQGGIVETIRGRVVFPGEISNAEVGWTNGTISRIDALDSDARLPAGYIIPGLVDIHCHGGGGTSFPDALNIGDIEKAAREHMSHGTTRLSAASSTMDIERMEYVLALLADACDAGIIDAIEIEGPFLSPERSGAQNPTYLQRPDKGIADRLIDATRGYAWAMTLAPELDGVRELVDHITTRGILPTWGHTNADSHVARDLHQYARQRLDHAPVRSRRQVAVHLFNAMRQMNHRAPGPVFEYIAAARAGDLVVELIGDGTHLSIDLVRSIIEILGPESVVLITDAMAAAGMPDGTYELSGLLVHVTNGIARLRGGNLAGGTSHLIDIVRTVVTAGIPLVDAVRMASTTPADVLGRSDLGRIAVGARADFVVVDDDLRPQRVIKDGRTVWSDSHM